MLDMNQSLGILYLLCALLLGCTNGGTNEVNSSSVPISPSARTFYASPPTSSYALPSQLDQEVMFLCQEIYEPSYSRILGAHKRVAPSSVEGTSRGILVRFADRQEKVFPIKNTLPEGQKFYCSLHRKPLPCHPGSRWDDSCIRAEMRKPNRWNY